MSQTSSVPLLSRIRAFLVPWLAYALVSACVGALIIGLVISLFGFLAAVVTLLTGLFNHSFLKSVVETSTAFPRFAQSVVTAMALSAAAGGLIGLIAALQGGGAGWIWGMAVLGGLLCWNNQFLSGHLDMASAMLGVFMAMVLVSFVNGLNRRKRSRPISQQIIDRYFAESWIAEPPFWTRTLSIALPLICVVGIEIYFTTPTFFEHIHYEKRLGFWTTWRNSRRLSLPNRFAGREPCQMNLKQVMLGLLMYQQDNDQKFPPLPKTPEQGVANIIQPYLNNPQVFQCPKEFFFYTGADPNSGDYTDYWFNSHLYNQPLAALGHVSTTIAWGDGNTGMGEGQANYSLSSIPAKFSPPARHVGGLNVVFSDGHVKWVRPNTISSTSSLSSRTLLP